MFKKLSSKFRKSAADSSAESGNQDPAGGRPAAPVDNVDRVALYRLLLDNFAETETMGLAQSLDLDYRQLPSSGYGGKIRELIMYFEHRGRLSDLLAACAQKRPDVEWGSVASLTEDKAKPLAAVEPEPHQQLLALLTYHFDSHELTDMARELDVKWAELEGPGRAAKSRSLVLYLANQDRLPQLLKKMKELRPHVAPIQDLALPQISQAQRAAIGQPARSRQAERAAPVIASDDSDLYQLIVDRFSESELATICFDIGIDYENLPGRDQADRTRALLDYLARRKQLDRLIVAGMVQRPDLDWQGVTWNEISQAKLPKIHRDAYDQVAIRDLLLRCFDTNDAFIEFCRRVIPHAWRSLSLTWPLASNTRELVSYCLRRGRIEELLTSLKENFPAEYAQYGPYKVD